MIKAAEEDVFGASHQVVQDQNSFQPVATDVTEGFSVWADFRTTAATPAARHLIDLTSLAIKSPDLIDSLVGITAVTEAPRAAAEIDKTSVRTEVGGARFG